MSDFEKSPNVANFDTVSVTVAISLSTWHYYAGSPDRGDCAGRASNQTRSAPHVSPSTAQTRKPKIIAPLVKIQKGRIMFVFFLPLLFIFAKWEKDLTQTSRSFMGSDRREKFVDLLFSFARSNKPNSHMVLSRENYFSDLFFCCWRNFIFFSFLSILG